MLSGSPSLAKATDDDNDSIPEIRVEARNPKENFMVLAWVIGNRGVGFVKYVFWFVSCCLCFYEQSWERLCCWGAILSSEVMGKACLLE